MATDARRGRNQVHDHIRALGFALAGNPQRKRARQLRDKAAALFERFNQAFWDDEFGFYAFALDGDKRKVLTVASNAGSLLASLQTILVYP
jgi:glycogen debranching enzyme